MKAVLGLDDQAGVEGPVGACVPLITAPHLGDDEQFLAGHSCGAHRRAGHGFVAVEGGGLQALVLLDAQVGAGVGAQINVGLRQEAARATGRVIDRLAQLRGDAFDHEADHRAGGIELASLVAAGHVGKLPDEVLVGVA